MKAETLIPVPARARKETVKELRKIARKSRKTLSEHVRTVLEAHVESTRNGDGKDVAA